MGGVQELMDPLHLVTEGRFQVKAAGMFERQMMTV